MLECCYSKCCLLFCLSHTPPLPDLWGLVGMNYTTATCRVDTPEAVDGWIELLNRPGWRWSWFATLTYKREVKPEAAERDFNRWMRIENQKRFGRRYKARSRSLSYARAIEYQKRGVVHYHALVGLAGQLSRFDAMKEWENAGALEWFETPPSGGYELRPRTGFARIFEYDPTLGATHYVSKYVTKSGEITVGYDPETGARLQVRSVPTEPVQRSMFDDPADRRSTEQS